MTLRRLSAVVVALLFWLGAPSARAEEAPIGQTIGEIEATLAAEDALLRHGGGIAPIWLDDGSRFLYAANGARDFGLFLVDPNANTMRQISDDAAVRSALSSAGADIDLTTVLRLSADGSEILLKSGDDIYAFNLQSHAARRAPDLTAYDRLREPHLISDQFPTTFGPLIEARSPDGANFITVQNDNLYVRSAATGALRPLTRDGSPRETWLNTQESAQSFNVFWAPDSRRIATLQLDTRAVWHEPLPHLLETPPAVQYVAYPRAGEPMHRFRPVVIDTITGQRTPLRLGDTENHYVDIIGWTGDQRSVLLRVIDREHKHLRVVAADAHTGASRTLLDETSPSYFDTPMTLGIENVYPLRRSNGFLYLSERTGWRAIELRDDDGALIRNITHGAWPVNNIVAIDEDAGFVYFRASRDPTAPFNFQLYRAPLNADGEPQLLTSGQGRNKVAMAPNNRYFIAQRSAPDMPPVVELRSADGALLRTLSTFDDSALRAAGFGGVETFVTPDTSGRWDVRATIMRPYGFNPSRRYPVVEVIYGGMQSSQTLHSYYRFGDSGDVNTLVRSLLHRGVVVVMVDAPGTPGRGRAFQDAVYRIWPQTVIANHVRAMREAARTRPWMDLQRVAVYGHSWGAYMAERAMIEAPDFYRAAAAHDGGSDFIDQPTYIEPFMGLPASNQEGYAAASNLTRVGEIQGPVLVFSAPFDVNSGFSPAFKFVDAMVRARKEVELFVMPSSSHRLYCCSRNEELYKVAVIQRFLLRHIGGAR